MYSFPNLESLCCSMYNSNCFFLTSYRFCRRQVRWFGILITLKIFQFVVIHTVKGFRVVNKAEVDVFLEFSCFFNDPSDVGNLISGSSAFSKPSFSNHKWLMWQRMFVFLISIPDHLICLLRNLYVGQEAAGRIRHGTMDWFQIGKGVRQGCILSPCLFNLCAEYIMWNAGLDEAQAGIQIAGRNINSLRYADDTTLMAESKEEIKSL